MSNHRSRRIDSIETNWSLVDHAHNDPSTHAAPARHELLERYSGAIWRYFVASTGDPEVAEELYQEFALRLVRGDFHRVAPEKGRFRDYLKTVAINLLNDHFRQKAKRPQSLPETVAEGIKPDMDSDDAEQSFMRSWRKELLQLAFEAMRIKNQTLYHVLVVQTKGAELSAEQKARELNQLIGGETTANHFRVMIHRARKLFAKMLRREIAISIGDDSTEAVEVELSKLKLRSYCTE